MIGWACTFRLKLAGTEPRGRYNALTCVGFVVPIAAVVAGNDRRTSVGWLATLSLLVLVQMTPSAGSRGSEPNTATQAMIHMPVATAAAPQLSPEPQVSPGMKGLPSFGHSPEEGYDALINAALMCGASHASA